MAGDSYTSILKFCFYSGNSFRFAKIIIFNKWINCNLYHLLQHLSDDYFLSSGDKIRYFFEKTAFNEDGMSTVLTLNKSAFDLWLGLQSALAKNFFLKLFLLLNNHHNRMRIFIKEHSLGFYILFKPF